MKPALNFLIAALLIAMAAHLTSLGATLERFAVNTGAACAFNAYEKEN